MNKALSIFGALLLIALIACSSQAQPTPAAEPAGPTQNHPAISPQTQPTAVPTTMAQPAAQPSEGQMAPPTANTATPMPTARNAQAVVQATVIPDQTQDQTADTQLQPTATPQPVQPPATEIAQANTVPGTASANESCINAHAENPRKAYSECFDNDLNDFVEDMNLAPHVLPFKNPENPDPTDRYTTAEIHNELTRFKLANNPNISYQVITSNLAEHPHLNAFPLIKHRQQLGQTTINPHFSTTQNLVGTNYKPFTGMETFLRCPFCHPIDASDFYTRGVLGFGTNHIAYGPHNFGEDSVMTVISKAMAQRMQTTLVSDAQSFQLSLPSIETITARNGVEYTLTTPIDRYNPGNLANYIRTPIIADEQPILDDAYNRGLALYPSFQPPLVNWEMLHPTLPIIQVTAWGELLLPYKPPSQNQDAVQPTKYIISFVLALHNAWDSYNHPGRLINQLKDEDLASNAGQNYYFNDHEVNQSAGYTTTSGFGAFFTEEYGAENDATSKYESEWHFTDYTVHSIVGDIQFDIIESPVLEQSNHSIKPSKNKWLNQCQPIPDAALRPKTNFWKGWQTADSTATLVPTQVETPTYTPFYVPNTLNVGFPLPGHIVTNSATAIGNDLFGNDQKIQDYLASCNS